jgi:hypothetical protein
MCTDDLFKAPDSKKGGFYSAFSGLEIFFLSLSFSPRSLFFGANI